MAGGQFLWVWQIMGVASECEIGGVERLMMFGMVVVGMVVVAVVRWYGGGCCGEG